MAKRLQPFGIVEIDPHAVDALNVRGRGDRREMRARIEQVDGFAFAPHGQAHLAREVLGAEHEAHDARRGRGDLIGVEQADRAFDGDQELHLAARHVLGDFGAAELVLDDAHLLDRVDLRDDETFDARAHDGLEVLDHPLACRG